MTLPPLESYRKEIEAALEYAGGSHTFEDVSRAVASGTMQFWPGPHSVVITEVIEHPRHTVLHFFLAAGKMPELEAMTPPILAWGRSRGCTRASLIGRPGWERSFLTRTGWHTSPLVMMETTL